VEEDKVLADSQANHAFLEEWGEYYRSVEPEAFTVVKPGRIMPT